MKELLRKIIHSKVVLGVRLIISNDSNWSFIITKIERRKDLLVITESFKDLTKESLSELLSPLIPIILSIEGKGIIHKKLSYNDEKETPLRQALLNIKTEDFWTQETEIDNQSYWLSIIRKDLLDEVLRVFFNFPVYNIFLGPYALNNIWPLLNINEEKFDLDSCRLKVNNDKISEIEISDTLKVGKNYFVGDDQISASLLISYANAVSYFLKISFNGNICEHFRKEFQYHKLIRATTVLSLTFVFVVLLINFLVFNQYQILFSNAQKTYQTKLVLLTHLENVKKEVELREEVVKQCGLLQKSSYSLLADKIAAVLPDEVMLTQLTFNPLKEKLRMEKEILLENNVIYLQGQTVSSLYLNDLLSRFKNEPGIKKVEIISYSQDNKESFGKFSLKISY